MKQIGVHTLVVCIVLLAAGCLALLSVPQLALISWTKHGQPARWYVRHTRPWLMAAMLVTAWALAL